MHYVRIATYVVKLQNPGNVERFSVPMPAKYKVLELEVSSDRRPRVGLRVRQIGPVHTPKRFLFVPGDRALPRVLLRPHDPPDSEDLQWSFWQALYLGGNLDGDMCSVFDVTHLLLEGFDQPEAALPGA